MEPIEVADIMSKKDSVDLMHLTVAGLRLTRSTLSFSKNLASHIGVIKYFDRLGFFLQESDYESHLEMRRVLEFAIRDDRGA